MNTKLSYRDYLKSDVWARKRAECISIHGDRCIVCGAGYVQVAHLRYTAWGAENPSTDLVPMCHTHHEFLDKMLKGFTFNKEKRFRAAPHLIAIMKIMEDKNLSTNENYND